MNKWTLLLVVSLVSFISTFDASSINVALFKISRVHEIDFSTASYLVTIYSIGAAIAIFPFAGLSDSQGKEKVFFLGLFMGFFAVLAGFYFKSTTAVFIARAFQGVSHGSLIVSGTPILASAFSKRKSFALGIHGFFVSAGLAIGPVASGILLESNSWKIIYGLQLPVYIFLIGFLFLNGFRPEPSIFKKLNLKGLRQSAGLLKEELFRYSSLIVFLTPFSISFIFVLTPYLLQDVQGMGTRITGYFMCVFPIMMSIVSPFSGRLSESLGSVRTAFLGLILILGASVLMSTGLIMGFMDVKSLTVILLIMCGSAMSLVMIPTYADILNSVNQERLGVASAVMSFSRILGFGLGPFFAAKLVSVLRTLEFSGLNPLKGVLINSFSVGFLSSALFAIIAIGFLFKKKMILKEGYE